MREEKSKEKTVLETILSWSENRPRWQRDALRRIVLNGQLDRSDIKELTELCKQDINQDTDRSSFAPLDASHLPANPSQGASISLVSITDVSDANNLAPNQTLLFEQNGLTIVYGDNATGKSGYVRILKRACRARHTGEILPNIYTNNENKKKASAIFTYKTGESNSHSLKWEDYNNINSPLSAISVFDSHCAEIHLSEQNEVAFQPFGLDIPDKLANACQNIKEIFTIDLNKKESVQNSFFKEKSWKMQTQVGQLLAGLKAGTDLQKFTDLATLNDQEQQRYIRLKEDLSKNPLKSSAEAKLKADNIKRLYTILNNIETSTLDEQFNKIISLDKEAKLKREAANLAAAQVFSSGTLEGIGSESWRVLWEAARQYSSQSAYKNEAFPPISDDLLCVLCQQQLNKDAIERMSKFEEFIKNDVARQAEQSEIELNSLIDKLSSIKINTISVKSLLQEIKIQDAKIAEVIVRFIASARIRRYLLFKNLRDVTQRHIPKLIHINANDLKNIEDGLRTYSDELIKSQSEENRKKLESEFNELNDRVNLNIQLIKSEIDRLAEIEFIKKCISDTNTTSITKLGNDIADSVITPKMRDRFQEEIVKLAADKVRVEIVRSGGKFGSPHYQVKLFAKPDAKISSILSEGEQKCVSFASFLTELATAQHKSSLIFDDPVSSLDHRWRRKIAERLISESKVRQIIVFTHDLVFLNDLCSLAESDSIPLHVATISRGSSGTGIITEGLPWKAKSVKDRIDALEKELSEAREMYDDNKESEYHISVSRIYSNLRSSWERALEDVAFSGVIIRHRDYINTKNFKKVSVITDDDCDKFHSGFKKCCDYTESHDPSLGRNATAPTPDEIKADINALKNWVDSIRQRQKSIT